MALLLLVCAPAAKRVPERLSTLGIEVAGTTVEPSAHPGGYSISPRKIVATVALPRGGSEPLPDQPGPSPDAVEVWLGAGRVAARAPPFLLAVPRHPPCSALPRAPPLA